MRRRTRTAAIVTAMVTAIVLIGSAVASAHVTVNPSSAAPNSYPELTFRAPNETAKSNFTRLVVRLPSSTPLAAVSTRPIPGWTITSTKAELAKPIVTDDGTTTEYLASITWTATTGGIAPGEYEDFTISAGPLPARGSVTFTAEQSYSDGSVVKWVEIAKPGGVEPEHPAPVLTIAASSAGRGDGDTALGLSITALGLGVVAVGLAALSWCRRRMTA